MSTVKERIVKDLEQVKEQGSARTQRIREIVQVAVGDAMHELKGGATEIRSLTQDAVTAVIEHLKSKGKQAKNEVMAAMEGAVAGVSDKSVASETQAQEQQILEAVDGALVAVETNQKQESRSFLSLLLAAFNALKAKLFASLHQENASLQELLAKWDTSLTEKYGDRYTQIKQRWQSAQTSYQATKIRMENGETSPVDQYQAQAMDKAAQAGAKVAQTEQAIKQQLKTFLHSTADKI
ncbi:hypothetical protein [Calothrix sp. NIES-3974]|uniref:hypothetical protein n=1 Tax=Calothrix sp. NIES-3974 TaxID=2005462 RepID=UPI000B60DAD0|nr:hypothetical protein [Calothrix sp. NIES-3974]BAZ06089.1 hypothetical protein NIES3974_27460 [Calothrix sp. NIES-3974]